MIITRQRNQVIPSMCLASPKEQQHKLPRIGQKGVTGGSSLYYAYPLERLRYKSNSC